MISEGVLLRQGRDGPVVRLSGDMDFHRVCEQLEAELAEAAPRLRGAAVMLDAGSLLLTTSQLLELESIVNRHAGVRIVQVIDSSGVRADEDAREAASSWEEAASRWEEDAPPGEPDLTDLEEDGAAPGLGAARIHAGGASLPDDGTAQLVRRTVRSGQRIVSSGHVVVVGDVNPGAEVVAGGDIVVLGTLRGVAHAGALGDERAVVVAQRLVPSQVRIGRHIGRAPEKDAPSGGAPEVARVQDGVIVIESSARGEASSWV